MAQLHPTASTSQSIKSDKDSLIQFQAELDDSVTAVRSLVHSWIPTTLGKEWDNPATNISSAYKSRPSRYVPPAPPGRSGPSWRGLTFPRGALAEFEFVVVRRLGLGANAGEREKQDAADRKLREQLMGKQALKPSKAHHEPAPSADAQEDAHSDTDDEESRTRSVKPKHQPIKAKHLIPAKLAGAGPSSKPPAASALASAPASPASATATATLPSSLVPDGSGAADAASKASKNKRKKEREKERLALAKRQKMAESHAEDLAARAAALAEASPAPSDAVSSTLRSPTLSLSAMDAASPALASPVMASTPVPVARPAHTAAARAEEEEDGSDDEVDEGGDVSTTSAGGAVLAGDKKKKKRRQKKKKAPAEEQHNKPVLDLTPAPAAAAA